MNKRDARYSRNLIELTHFISLSFMSNDGKFNGMFSFSRSLWKSVYLVLSLLSESLLLLNHV